MDIYILNLITLIINPYMILILYNNFVSVIYFIYSFFKIFVDFNMREYYYFLYLLFFFLFVNILLTDKLYIYKHKYMCKFLYKITNII